MSLIEKLRQIIKDEEKDLRSQSYKLTRLEVEQLNSFLHQSDDETVTLTFTQTGIGVGVDMTFNGITRNITDYSVW